MSVEYVTFIVAGNLLGLPAKEVQEVVPDMPLTPVPRSKTLLVGLMNLRGNIISVIDLRKRLGLSEAPTREGNMNIIIPTAEEIFSIRVDSVGDVVVIDENKIEAPPSTLSPDWRQCCQGVFQMKERLLITLDVKKILEN